MIRVSELKEELEENARELSADGMTPDEQLKEIRKLVLSMIRGANALSAPTDPSGPRS